MIASWWAVPIATACLALGDFVNRRVYGWLPEDRPGPGRKQHERPTPLAGVLLPVAIAPWLIAANAWLVLAAIALVATVGFVDDRDKEGAGPIDDAGVDWRIKAAALFSAAALTATHAHDPTAAPFSWLVAFCLTFVLGNALNFLDNTDGVTASLGATLLLGWSLLVAAAGHPAAAELALPAWATACGFAALAFLPWNWPKARFFLGDSGAYTIGLTVSAAIVPQVAWDRDPRLLLTLAVPLIDFGQVVTARLAIGVPPWVGDRRHLTHITQNLGLPRVFVAPLFTVLAAGTLVLAFAWRGCLWAQ
ncbi:MAG: hypothetical protein AB8H80_23010 [Planctomycetota bacterium]